MNYGFTNRSQLLNFTSNRTMKNHIAVILGFLAIAGTAVAGDYSSGKGVSGKEPISCNHFYLEVSGGWTFPPDLDYDGAEFAMDDGFNFGGAIGKSLNDRIDVEFEAYYSETGYTGFDDELSGLALMFNGFYNIPISQRLTAYVGGGLGALQVEYRPDGAADDADWVLGAQAIAGVRYSVTECVELFTEFRCLAGTSDALLYGTDDVEFRTNDLTAGLRFRF